MLLQKGLNYKKEKRKKKCVIILSCALVGGKLFVVPLRAAWLFFFVCEETVALRATNLLRATLAPPTFRRYRRR